MCIYSFIFIVPIKYKIHEGRNYAGFVSLTLPNSQDKLTFNKYLNIHLSDD